MRVQGAESAHDDLVLALGRQRAALGRPPAGALSSPAAAGALTCSGGRATTPRAVAGAFAEAPTADFFCAGEIGAVSERSYVHGFTATLAVFPG